MRAVPDAYRGTRRTVGIVVLVAAILAGAAFLAWWVAARQDGPLRTETVQSGLEHPWDLAFTDSGRMLVTERAGRVRVYASGERNAPLLTVSTIPDVRAELESGLMGIAVAGDTVFVCATRGPAEDEATWHVDLLAATLAADGSLSTFEPMPIGPTIGGPRHQGCAVQIGPDKMLWFSIGDANLPAGQTVAMDPTVLNGKVVRLNLDGSVPPDAAFPSGVVSVGHRNPQGLAFRDDLVVEVEHGTDVNDEINVIEPGANYGYPCFTGAADPGPIPEGCGPPSDYRPPAWASGDPTLATSGAVFLTGEGWGDWAGDLVVTTLKEEDLRRFVVDGSGRVTLAETLLDRRFGRLRAAVIGPDHALYLSTSNGDDRIIRVTRSDEG
ncbi:MAG TPA: PQQ-dependent sugar dehydrogenase [Candidatus Limnocylindria bacterium]|nr:PQQ-dependent sugar dehydrogenase [Candidatus Limnocylindria bacterium]